jgi:hypothetical protein
MSPPPPRSCRPERRLDHGPGRQPHPIPSEREPRLSVQVGGLQHRAWPGVVHHAHFGRTSQRNGEPACQPQLWLLEHHALDRRGLQLGCGSEVAGRVRFPPLDVGGHDHVEQPVESLPPRRLQWPVECPGPGQLLRPRRWRRTARCWRLCRSCPTLTPPTPRSSKNWSVTGGHHGSQRRTKPVRATRVFRHLMTLSVDPRQSGLRPWTASPPRGSVHEPGHRLLDATNG